MSHATASRKENQYRKAKEYARHREEIKSGVAFKKFDDDEEKKKQEKELKKVEIDLTKLTEEQIKCLKEKQEKAGPQTGIPFCLVCGNVLKHPDEMQAGIDKRCYLELVGGKVACI